MQPTAADVLGWCGASRAEPLPLEGLRERFLPEATFRGRQNAKFRYAVLAACYQRAYLRTECLLCVSTGLWARERHLVARPLRRLRP